MRFLTIFKVLVTALAVALAAYGISSIWCPVYLAGLETLISWLCCVLSYTDSALLSALIFLVLLLVLFLLWRKRRSEVIHCLLSKRNSDVTHEGTKCARSFLPKLPPCPYYKLNGKEIACFKYKSDLHLMRFAKGIKSVARKDQYVVAKPYTVSFKLGNGSSKCITVPKGMLTDLSSAPFPLRCIVGRVGPHLEATIVHDYLYIAWQDYEEAGCVCDAECAKKCDEKDSRCAEMTQAEKREFADRIMLEGMKASGMGCKAYLIYWVIRVGGGCVFLGRNQLRYVDLGKCKCSDDSRCTSGDGNASCDCGSRCECESAEA